MVKAFQEKILRTIKRFDLIEPYDRIIVAVSGGPDSISLLFFLHQIRKKFQLRLFCIHINHLIRNDEALKDAEFTANFAINLRIPVRILNINVPLFAKEKRLSLEHAARIARYLLLEKHAKDLGATKIATGHNLDDQVETILMRILRGTGMSGLLGIYPKMKNIFIRPLVEVSRDEIMEYIKQSELPYRMDSSNLSEDFLRNKVRNDLIPHLTKHYNTGIRDILWNMCQIIRDEDEFMEEVSSYFFPLHMEIASSRIKFLKIHDIPKPILRRMIRKGIQYIKGDLDGICYYHIEQIIDCMYGKVGMQVHLPGNIIGEKKYDFFSIESGISQLSRKIPEVLISIPGTTNLPAWNMRIISDLRHGVPCNLTLGPDEILADWQKIRMPVRLRSRKPGDTFCPFGMKGSKKLKDFFIELKIEKKKRESIPLVVDRDDTIVWIVGYRADDRFRITACTEKVLYMKVEQLDM